VAILIDFPEVNFSASPGRAAAAGRSRAVVRQPATVGVEAQAAALVPAVCGHPMIGDLPLRGAFLPRARSDAEFVGHPLAALSLPTICREEYASTELDPGEALGLRVAGSRQSEIHQNLPQMLQAAANLESGPESGEEEELSVSAASGIDHRPCVDQDEIAAHESA